MRGIIVVLFACTPARPVIAPITYNGVTTCGTALPPPAIEPAPRLPEREPVPSFIAPRSPVGALVESGGLSSDVVDRSVRGRAAMFGACYLHVLARDPDAPPLTARARFTIVEDGTVAGLAIHGDDPAADACLCDSFVTLRFPAQTARTIVTYPLLFR